MNTWVRDNEPADVRSVHVYYTIWWDVLGQFRRFLESFKDSTLQDFFVADQFATTEILAVRKYGEIEQKPSHFGRHRK